MRASCLLLAAASLLAVVPAWADRSHRPAATVPQAKAAKHEAKALAARRGEVKRLEQNVAAQEASGHAAAQRLQRQDAEIAELKRQLQAVKPSGPTSPAGS